MMNLLKIVEQLSAKSVLVIGDLGVDEFVYGTSDRICPEAPVPIFKETKTELVPGLACNVAANIKSLGGVPILLGLTGEDASRLDLEESLAIKGLDSSLLFSDNQRHTTKKKRFVVDGRHLVLRVDQETKADPNFAQEKELYRRFLNSVEAVDVVVMSDYGKGVLTKKLIEAIGEHCYKTGKITICDPKPDGRNCLKYSKVKYLTPNKKEAMLMYQELSGKESSDPFVIGNEIRSSLLTDAVIITQGQNGIAVVDDSGLWQKPAVDREVYDVCGAGDTVVATLSLALAAGADIHEAVALANFAASIAVSRFGTTTVSNEELYSGLSNT